MRRVTVPQAGPQFFDFDGPKSLRKSLCRVRAAKPQCPFASEEIIDDLGQLFEAKRKFFAVELLKLNANVTKPGTTFFYFFVDIGGA
jgi:hypothetical protein